MKNPSEWTIEDWHEFKQIPIPTVSNDPPLVTRPTLSQAWRDRDVRIDVRQLPANLRLTWLCHLLFQTLHSWHGACSSEPVNTRKKT